ncbi:MAG: formate dehydrogenase accessory sulfurtransferase FdhD [Gordonibacter sp.]
MAIVEYRTCAPRATEERPIRIFLNGDPVAVSQGSPYDLAELAVGYLLSEGLIADRDRFVEVRADEEGAAVYVDSGEQVHAGYVPLHRVTSAGCAQSALLRGGAPIAHAKRLASEARFDPDALLAQMDELCERSPRRNTGACVHGCGLGAADSSSLMLVREDIGRHNAMDKLIGQAWLDRVDVRDKALFITGRISAEMALKAHRAGCAVLVSRKSATDEAARHAEALGVTLVSHCRDGRLRVLSCPERLLV